jgi:hypothetical protein
MITNAVINFISRQCKNSIHKGCCGIWQGLGFEVFCDCECHKKKEQQASGKVGGPISNAISSLTQEVTQDND